MSPGPQLRDIQLPPEPGWWPPAIGWWLLAILALLLLAVAIRFAMARIRRSRRRRAAAALVRACLEQHPAEHQGAELAAAFSALLRRAARQDAHAASLDRGAWLAWLDGNDPERPFSAGPGRLLAEAPFRPQHPRAPVAALAGRVQSRLLQAIEEGAA